MKDFHAHEFSLDTMTPTGAVELYRARGIASAVRSCLYTRRLTNGRAYTGPTGRVVYSGGSGWTITPRKTVKPI